MPLASALSYVQGLLDGLPMPGGDVPGGYTPNLVCKVTAPEIFDDPGVIPVCYLWLPEGRESRDRPVGTMPRNSGPGTGSGFKSIVHRIAGEMLWTGTGPDLLFYAMVDAVMAALRTAKVPVLVPDPCNAGLVTQMADAGEDMTYRTAVRPVPDQQANQYQAVFQIPLTEVIQA